MKNYDEFIEGLRENMEVPEKIHEKFADTLNHLPEPEMKNIIKKKNRHFKWTSVAAAALLLACTMSIGVYAAVKFYDYTISDNEDGGVDVEMSKLTKDYIPPITITPNYLPEGYKVREDGVGVKKYSENGVWGGDGLTISDAGWIKNFTIPNVSNYEQKQIGQAQALWTYTKGAQYPYHILLFYEEDGHVIEIFGSSDISEDDMMKVCENMTYAEVPERDPNRTYQAFSEDRLIQAKGETADEGSAQIQEFSAEGLTAIGDEISLVSSPAEAHGNIYVKDIHITDEVNTALINKDTAADYERAMSWIENNKLKTYTRTVTEWTGEAYKEKEIGTVNVKNVEVTLEVKNHSEINYDEVNIQPEWRVLEKMDSGNYAVSGEIPGYTMQESYVLSNDYGISADGYAYYFDSSSFPQDSHFFNMALKPSETKEVHLWFAIPEDVLEDSYLCFDNIYSGTVQFVKVVQ